MTEQTPQQDPRQVLDREAAALDSDTTRALRLARDEALNRGDRRRAAWPLWSGTVAAGVLVVGLLLPLRNDPTPMSSGVTESVIADLDVLSQEDDLGLIEDLEFLDWLSSVDEDLT